MGKKKKSEADLKDKIKAMESEKREACVVPIELEKKTSFDSWHHQRSTKIPKQHVKEILAADFRSRGLGKEATMAEYDKALKLYGIEL